jgi:NAD(P)-dependent dehydrogenase (short-subunit alcohol dehydrogenase family)
MTDDSPKEAGMAEESVVVVGGTSGIGREIAIHFAKQGMPVVITGRELERCAGVAADMPGTVTPLALQLERPHEIHDALAPVGPVRYLVVAAMERDNNSIRDYDIDRALRLVTQKLIGYPEVVHTLLDRLSPTSSVLLFGGMAKDRPYPGSTTVTTVNGGVVGLVRTLTVELAPIRVNALHPAFVVDSPYWVGKNLDHAIARTPTGRLVTMAEVVDAAEFLLTNPSANGLDLRVDGGWATS